VPSAIEGSFGVTAIETKVALETVNNVSPKMPVPESVAVTVAEPTVFVEARPSEPAAFDTLTTAPPPESDQVTELVMSAVEESVNVPVAVNCCEFPSGPEGLLGVTEIETSAAELTV